MPQSRESRRADHGRGSDRLTVLRFKGTLRAMDRPQPDPNPASKSPTRYDPSSFVALATGLGAQAQILLGVIENPITKKKEEVDLERAKNIIELLEMLEEKTQGNLTKEETA